MAAYKQLFTRCVHPPRPAWARCVWLNSICFLVAYRLWSPADLHRSLTLLDQSDPAQGLLLPDHPHHILHHREATKEVIPPAHHHLNPPLPNRHSNHHGIQYPVRPYLTPFHSANHAYWVPTTAQVMARSGWCSCQCLCRHSVLQAAGEKPERSDKACGGCRQLGYVSRSYYVALRALWKEKQFMYSR